MICRTGQKAEEAGYSQTGPDQQGEQATLPLTSLPRRSFLFSITPQGAIPIVQIFFEDREKCSLRASPTCLATPARSSSETHHS